MLTGKKVLVIGLARSGKAAVKLLQKLNATITINEGKELEKIEGYQEYLDAGIEIIAGGHPDELFERDFDFVVIDTDSVFDNKKAKLLSMADKVIFVTNQNKMSVMATNVLAENINGINSEKYFYICNNFEENKENTLSMSEVPLRFSINEYIGHIEDYDKLKSSDFVNYTGFQKAAYLFI